jgi:hypothetical protein
MLRSCGLAIYERAVRSGMAVDCWQPAGGMSRQVAMSLSGVHNLPLLFLSHPEDAAKQSPTSWRTQLKVAAGSEGTGCIGDANRLRPIHTSPHFAAEHVASAPIVGGHGTSV